jgi:acyl-CoA dehydrogenase
MLMQMRALTAAARTLCYATAVALDRPRAKDAKVRGRRRRPRRAADADRQGLLHRHRQRGRLARRAGPWRHGLHRGDRRRAALRDARITSIYEGTNGIQAIDLPGRDWIASLRSR